MSGRAYDPLAGETGFLIATEEDCLNPTAIIGRQFVPVYILYRNRVRLGKRRNPSGLLALLKEKIRLLGGIKA